MRRPPTCAGDALRLHFDCADVADVAAADERVDDAWMHLRHSAYDAVYFVHFVDLNLIDLVLVVEHCLPHCATMCIHRTTDAAAAAVTRMLDVGPFANNRLESYCYGQNSLNTDS